MSTRWELALTADDWSHNPMQHPRMHRLMRGIERTKALQQRDRRRDGAGQLQPPDITPELLRGLAAAHPESDERRSMLYAACALGSAACLRPGELYGAHPPRARDLLFYSDRAGTRLLPHGSASATPDHAVLVLGYTKTNQTRPERRPVGATWAVEVLWRWCCRNAALPSDRPLFSHGGARLTPMMLIGHLRRAVRAAGYANADAITGKCFRRGASTALAEACVPESDIAHVAWAAGSAVPLAHYASSGANHVRRLAVSRQL
jgi:hypothetical protein